MKCTKCVNCGTNGKNALCHNPFCNFVQGYGSDHPTYMIVSDWVRHSWVKHNRLFSGNVTPELDNVLKTSGIKKDECYFTSLVKCPTIKKQEKGRNEKEGNPKKDVIDVCSEYLKEEILQKRPKVIVALGAFSFNYFFPKLSLAEKRCQPLWYEIDLGNNEKFGCYVVGIYHIENMVFTAEFDLIINKAFEQAYNLINHPEKTKHPQVNYKRITTINGLLNVLKRVKEVPVFAYDLEASSLNHRKAKLLSIGISWKVNTGISFPIYVKDTELCDKLLNNVAPKERRSLAATLDKNPPLKSFWGDKHNEVMEIVKQIFAVPCKKGGHNTWYDNLVLHYNGVEVNNYAFDTMIMYHLLDEERPKGLDDLSWVLTDKGGYKMEKEKYLSTSESNYANIPVDVLLDYNSGDADCTFEIYTKLKPKIIETGVAKLFAKICMPLQKILMKASIIGVKVDRQYVKDTQKLLENRIKDAEDAIKKIAEKYYPKVVIITETAQKGKDPTTKYLNIASAKDLRELMFEKMGLKAISLTESGAQATDESTLKKLSKKNDVAKLILEHRKASKLKSTYLDGMLEMLDENDRVHPSFNLCGTKTGRLASYDPNLQNIPRDKTIKRMFVPEEGYVMAEADMSQNELRVVAGLSNDSEMNRIYDSEGDIHTEFASTAFKKKLEDVTKEERSIAKCCFDENSFILTTQGYVRAKDLGDKELIDLNGKPQSQVHFFEKRKGYEIELLNGNIIHVTKDHKFEAFDKKEIYWKPACEFKVGDNLGLRKSSPTFGDYYKFHVGKGLRTHTYEQDIVFDEDLAYTMGLYLSDGSVVHVKKGSSMSILVKHQNREVALRALKNFGVKERVYENKDYSLVTIRTKALADWVEENFGRKEGKHIPDFIYTSPYSVVRAFLAGLLDTDTTITNRVTFINTNETLSRDVAKLGTLLGYEMYFHSYNYNTKIDDKKYSGIIYNVVFITKPDVDLLVKKDSLSNCIDKYYNQNSWNIDRSEFKDNKVNGKYNDDMYNYRKGNAKYLTTRSVSKFGLPHKEYNPTSIVSIKECDINVCVMETSTHYFIGEGFNSHNCNFLILYGGGPGVLMSNLEDSGVSITKHQAEKVLEAWDKKFSMAVSYLNSNVTRFMNHLVLTTPWGRSKHAYRHFLDKAKLESLKREGKNFMVQSFASDIVLLIITRMVPELEKIGARMISTVHDSILIECPKDKVEELKKICKKNMWLKLPELHGHMVKSGLELSEKSWGDKEEVDLESVAIN